MKMRDRIRLVAQAPEYSDFREIWQSFQDEGSRIGRALRTGDTLLKAEPRVEGEETA